MLENINPMAGRDKRPPADLLGAAEDALDTRALAALAKAWSMAAERGLIAGKYFAGQDVQAIAQELAGYNLTKSQAREVLELATLEIVQDGRESVDDALILDKIWDVIA